MKARLLARFNTRRWSSVPLLEENGTAYMVMPYLQGDAARRSPLDDRSADRSLGPLGINPILDALELLHREGVYHRDIAPDNILRAARRVPVLLDFGAARRAIGDHTQTLTRHPEASYAPIEAYAEWCSCARPWDRPVCARRGAFYLLRVAAAAGHGACGAGRPCRC